MAKESLRVHGLSVRRAMMAIGAHAIALSVMGAVLLLAARLAGGEGIALCQARGRLCKAALS